MRRLHLQAGKKFLALCLIGLFVSCNDTIPNRSLITRGSSTDTPLTCEADEDTIEIDENGDPLDGSELSGTPTNTITVKDKIFFCVPKPLVRPDNAVFWKPNFCICNNKRPVSFGNCSAICSDKATNGADILYGNFTVTEAISLGGLGNMYAWCKTNLPGDTTNPECELQAKDENGNVLPFDVTIPTNSNSLTSIVTDLPLDKTYVLTLVEKSSGAKSNSIQLIKFSPDIPMPTLGPLKNVPVSQYACIVREFSEDTNTGEIFFDSIYRLHFYFIPRIPPNPIPAGNANLFCHDIFNPLYGYIDSELFPRFELTQGAFNLWDNTDPRFYDNNGDGFLDANMAIVQKTRSFGATIPDNTNFFQPFKPLLTPEQLLRGDAPEPLPLGFFMAPWIDQSNFRAYCPNSTHYNSTNPLFRAMRDIIGVDTEGLYIGEKAPETIQNSDGTFSTGLPDRIFIRETDLKAVWFYLRNGVPTVPTDTTVANNAVYFYYPLNKDSPFVKNSTQRIFRVKGGAELQANNPAGATSSGTNTAFPPHDRRIGCIPKF